MISFRLKQALNIINIYSEARFLSEGKPDVKKIKPFLLTMPDNKFWSIADQIGKAWSDGVAMQDRLKKEQHNK